MSEVCRCGHGPGSHAQIGGTWECWMCNCTLYVTTKSTAPMTSAVGDAAALTDRQALAEFIGRANRPNLSPGGRLAETDSWLWLADALLSSDWLAGYVTTARAAAWEAGHGWCDDGIDGMCDHKPFDSSPYDHEHDWIEAGEPWDPQACGVCGAVRR